MYEKILRDPLLFPDEVSPSARSILTGLLTRDPAQRLGVNGADEIKRHPFFEKIDWQRLAQKKIQPPFKPSVRSPVDVSNFDTVFTAEQPLDSVVEGSQLSKTVQAQFEGNARPCAYPMKKTSSNLLGRIPVPSPCLFCRLFVQRAWNRRARGLMAEGQTRSSPSSLTLAVLPYVLPHRSASHLLVIRLPFDPPFVPCRWGPAYPVCLMFNSLL
jgi:serine/threonine protein kinase